MSDSGKAVFLSYASQDAEAAKKICDALRAAGIEVWFDQSELVGGDAWDQKIRKQIGSCALFVPIISANTQARAEGYFRLEWRLADQRTHLMGRSKTFLLPVAIDDTTDAEADVPDAFTAVQWTKAPAGELPPGFPARVKKLLDGQSAGRASRPDTAHPAEHRGAPTEKPFGSGFKGWWLVFPFFGLSMAAILYFNPPRSPERMPPAATEPPAAPRSEARQLALRAKGLIENGDDANRQTFATAEELLKRAVALDPGDGEATAIYAQLSRSFYRYGFDRSDARNNLSHQLAERAVMLAPDSREAQFAMAYDYYRSNPTESEKRLRQMLAQQPDDKRLLRTLGVTLRIQNRREEAVAAWQKAADLPGSDAESLAEIARTLNSLGRQVEAEAALDRSLALRASGRTLMFKLWLLLQHRGELDAAQAMLGQLPAWAPFEDRGAYQAYQLWMWRREPDKAIAALERVPREQLYDNTFAGPKRLLTGRAHQMAGRTDAARNEWKRALQVAESMLAEERNPVVLGWRAWLQAALGESTAEVSRRVFDETVPRLSVKGVQLASIDIQLGNYDRALSVLERFVAEREYLSASDTISAAALKLDPIWDPVRHDPRFEALLARVVQDEASLRQGQAAQGADDRGQANGKAATAPDEKSVAVLAFANLSDAKANEYFSDGISEELLNVLAKVPGLKVSARTSAFYFKGKETPIPEIAQKLGVAYVVEGSVRKQGDKVRITAQLIKAADGFHVWSDTFTRDLKDIFAVQDEIAGLIAQAMQVKLGITAPQAGPSGQAKIPAAYDAYLQARGIENREWYDEKSYPQIVALLEKAVELDPDFAVGWAQLSFAHAFTYFANLDHTEARLAKAKTAIETAFRLAPNSPEVLSGFGSYYYYGFRDYDRAREYFEQAGRLLPNSPVVAFYAGDIDRRQARWASALANLRRAVELDPINTGYLNVYRSVLSAVRRYDESVAISRRQLALNPDREGEQLGHAYAVFSASGSKKEGDELFARMSPEVFDSPRVVNLRKAWAFYTGDFGGYVQLDQRQPYYEQGGMPRYQQALLAAIAYEAHGDVPGARARLAGLPEQMRTRLEAEPNNSDLWQRLAQIEAILGHANEAERCIARALALVPEGRDAIEGIDIARSRAFVLARTGHEDQAIAEYARLLGIPGSPSLHSLRHGAFWAILRGDPSWEAILSDPKFSAPLF